MCGITGIINLDKKAVDRMVLSNMTTALEHRGPDDEGFFIGPKETKNIGLGHRRLSILDLSYAGHQPMFYDNNNLVIVFNGEIYNYLEIRQELIAKGYKFKSNSDTEVILASYKEWGTECQSRFNGMWSFAIFDKKKDLIFASRDHLGIKPFYYWLSRDQFAFASEIKAILTLPGFKPKANEKKVWEYLIGGLLDYSEETFFQGVRELRRGHFLILKNKKISIKKYWDIDINNIVNYENEADYAEKFKELMNDSVKLRLRSDVPIGSCLSGGLDSSLIVCIVNDFLKGEGKVDQLGKWQQTFSACYDDKIYKNCDEREYISAVIKKTKAHSHYVFPNGKKLSKEIEKLTYHQDSPFGSTSIYAQYNVFRLASQKKIKVMLDGQGADEMLAGYRGYFNSYFAELFREMKFIKLFSEFYYFNKNHPGELGILLKTLFKGAIRGYLGSFISKIVRDTLPENEVFSPDFRNRYKYPAIPKVTNDIFRNSLYNQLDYSLSSLLRYEDRDSMAFAIESRVPFLDYRLVEFIFSLPNDQKINYGTTKWVMRQASKGVLPEKIRTRQDKIGFATPEESWIKKDLKDEMKKVFASESFKNRGFYDSKKTLEKFEEYLSGKITNYQLFWRLYNLEVWYKIFID